MSTTRYTIDLDSSLNDALSALADRKNVSKAEVIRRALATYKYIAAQTEIADRKVSITDNSDEVLKDIVIP